MHQASTNINFYDCVIRNPMQITIEHLQVSFDNPQGDPLRALGPLSFDVEVGSFVAVLGPSGCGKSTLIRVIAGLQPATQGAVLLDNQPVKQPSPQIGLMFQDANLMPWRTVVDNIALPLELAGVSRSSRHDQAKQLLPRLGLEGFADAHPGNLSGGMAQRVALGRVLIQKPDVLLLDEPFGALDALTREQISLDLLKVWYEERQTAMMITHDINEAVLMADRIIVLSQRPGHIIEDMSITLARPRQLDMIYTDDFAQYARRVRDAINRA